jgi:hypothetical protein
MKLPVALATLTLVLTAAVPAARADEPAATRSDVPPEVRYPPSSVRIKLVAGGLAISGLAYAAVFGSARSWPEERWDEGSDTKPGDPTSGLKEGIPGADRLFIPFVGPWLALGKSECPTTADNKHSCNAFVYVRGILFVIDGIAQIAGLGLVAEGIFMKTEGGRPAKKSLALGLPFGITVHPVPVASARSTGLGVIGNF